MKHQHIFFLSLVLVLVLFLLPVFAVAKPPDSAVKFVILKPTDSTVGAPVTVTVEAQKSNNKVDESYQNDVTLVASGSATGTGLVDIVNGVGTIEINDEVAETVTLSLSDTEATGLDVSSTQQVTFDPASDTTAPSAINDLVASNPTTSSIDLSWTAPGDDESVGTAATYDIRYSESNINNESKWNSATQVSDEPTPSAAGSSESMTISELTAGTKYFFAIKTSDEVPNESDLSNAPSETTVTIAEGDAEWSQQKFWFRDDDGDEITATGFGAEDVNQNTNIINVAPDTNFRLRFAIKLTNADGNIAPQLEFKEGTDCATGNWTVVTPESSVFSLQLSQNFINAAITAQWLVGGPNFIAGQILESTNPAESLNMLKNESTEYEWSLKASESIPFATTYSFRITNNSTVLDTYDQCPSLTTQATPPPPICGNEIIETGEQCESPFDLCCDSSTCQFKSSDVVCRLAQGQCDLEEKCAGSSASCPIDAKAALGTSCNDNLWCSATDQCDGNGNCVQVITRDCSANNISGIATCGNDSDNIPFTWDFRNLFISSCDEAIDSCASGDPTITSVCDVQQCQAQCDATNPCSDTNCNQLDGCVGNDYYNYDDVANSCESNCRCTNNECGAPNISYNDPICTACQTDDDCNSLDQNYCDGTAIKHDEGRCVNYICEKETTVVQNCNDGLSCNGQESCSGAQCVAGTPVNCSQYNISGIGTCANSPDDNLLTRDYRAIFSSQCQEPLGTCTTGDQKITHSCNISDCQAQCESDSDCSDGATCVDCLCIGSAPPPPSPPPPSGGGGIRPTTIIFSGKAFPGAKILVIDKPVADAARTVSQEIITQDDGSFQTSFVGIMQSRHSFGLIVKDKEGRNSQTKFFTIDVFANDLIEKDVVISPTIDFASRLVTRGNNATIIGYASPESSVALEIDGIIKKEVKAEEDGSYRVEIATGELDFGNHRVRTKQIISEENRESDFSPTNTLVVSRLVLPKADLSGDGKIDIKDWSMFLFHWTSKDMTQKKIIDFNGDGKVDISDFSIFVRNIKK